MAISLELGTVSRFRKKRGQRLAQQIAGISSFRNRNITILDVGGREGYWANVGNLSDVGDIFLLNLQVELTKDKNIFTNCPGDARDLSQFADQSIDLVHSNSVIEHVGGWPDMEKMARECRRVGRSGWIQTPAWEFPIEPHQKLPFIHWFGQPIRRQAMRLSMPHSSMAERRTHVDMTNMLTRREFGWLFRGCDIEVERFMGWPKSYVARW